MKHPYLLDTNICIPLLNGTDRSLVKKIQNQNANSIHICSVVKAELLFGAIKSERRLENERRLKIFFSQLHCIPFDDHAAEHYGEIRYFIEKTGSLIGPNDLMIAACALASNSILITRNQKEFSKIPQLKLEIW